MLRAEDEGTQSVMPAFDAGAMDKGEGADE